MYERHFGLDEAPFSSLPDPKYLVPFPQHIDAAKNVEYSIKNSDGFTLLSGETGCGKTVLLRHIQQHLGEEIMSGFITDTLRLEGNVLERVLFSLGMDAKEGGWTRNFKQLTDFLLKNYALGKRIVVFFDEAQNLSPKSLEELRMLSNINTGNARLIEFVLAGTYDLLENLAHPENDKFSQRIDHTSHLHTLSEEETRLYIHKRLAIAGATDNSIFTKEACQLIYRTSDGIPRIINRLCHASLTYAYGMGAGNVTPTAIEAILKSAPRSWSELPAGYRPIHSLPSEKTSFQGYSPLPSPPDIVLESVEYTQTPVHPLPSETQHQRPSPESPEGIAARRFDLLKTQILRKLKELNSNLLVVTSPTKHNGKTNTSVHLATNIARSQNQTVLLVDLDLRRPSIHKYFDISPEQGVTDLIRGQAEFAEVAFNPGIPRLVVLPGTEAVVHSTEFLSTPAIKRFIDEVRDRYPQRIIIFDMPPVLGGADVLSFLPFVDNYLLVLEAGRTTEKELEETRKTLSGATILGTVLNKAQEPQNSYH